MPQIQTLNSPCKKSIKMHTIFKYKIGPVTEIELPKNAEILTVGSQGSDIFLWAKVDPQAEKETRRFVGFGTGHDIPDQLQLAFIGTVFFGELVFHIFEEIRSNRE